MATKGKDVAQGKERRGVSPSNPPHTNTPLRKRSSKLSIPASSDTDVPTPSEKQTPHYLKPTISSCLDQASKCGKKQSSEGSTTQKPALNRRRSFDKPPSPSRVQKELLSPSTRERTIRSSSVSPKTNTLLKPISDSVSKTPTGGKLYAKSKSLKKSTNTIIQKEANASTATSKPPSSPVITNILNVESEEEDQESPVTMVEEEMVKVESKEEFPAEISISENKENVDLANAEPKNAEDENVKTCDDSTLSEDQDASLAAQVEEIEEKIHAEETTENHILEEENHSNIESNNDHPDQSFASQPKVEAEDKEGEEGVTEIFSIGKGKATSKEDRGNENKLDKLKFQQGTTLDEKEVVDEGNQRLKFKEREELEVVVEEEKPEAENVVLKHQGGQGKKDCPAYNDVIEETASKLLEKRKNKVKALVGAFETVISLQEPEA